jgi:ADP-ribose pyrophosphatase YjhB (NUDIX family)
MARPRVAAGLLVHDDQGRVLMVKPTYKDGWDIPGGYVEPDESPAQRQSASWLRNSASTEPRALNRPGVSGDSSP